VEADIAIWDPEETRTVQVEDQHDTLDYAFEGREVTRPARDRADASR
jgi:dihydropyrimidinase